MIHKKQRIFNTTLSQLANGSKQLADVNPQLTERYRRHALSLFTACAVGLIPWVAFLAFTLSPSYQAHHWRLVWTGFDVLLFASLATTAYLGWRRRQIVIGAAVMTATLLLCDAWFDITLDLGTPDIWGSVASAIVVELPLAVFLLRRAYLLIRLSAELIYPMLGYEQPPHSLLKIPIFALTNRDIDAAREPNKSRVTTNHNE